MKRVYPTGALLAPPASPPIRQPRRQDDERGIENCGHEPLEPYQE